MSRSTVVTAFSEPPCRDAFFFPRPVLSPPPLFVHIVRSREPPPRIISLRVETGLRRRHHLLRHLTTVRPASKLSSLVLRAYQSLPKISKHSHSQSAPVFSPDRTRTKSGQSHARAPSSILHPSSFILHPLFLSVVCNRP